MVLNRKFFTTIFGTIAAYGLSTIATNAQGNWFKNKKSKKSSKEAGY